MNYLKRISATRFLVRATLAFSVTVLTACGSMHSIKDVPEYLNSEFDNASPREFITPADLAKIKLGMTPLQVRNRLGPAMLSDKDQTDRWDYVLKKGASGDDEYVPYGIFFKDYRVVKMAELPKPPESIVGKETPGPALPPAAVMVPPTPPAPAEVPAPAPSMETGSAKVDDAAAINDMVNGWAQAWSSKDFSKYESYYADTFEHHMKSRAAWEKSRRKFLSKPGPISVVVSDVKVDMQSDSLATVTFHQEYTSKNYKDSGTKTLTLSKASGSWKIQSESFVKD